MGLSMLLKNKREHEVGRETCSEDLGKVGRGKKVDIRKSHCIHVQNFHIIYIILSRRRRGSWGPIPS